MKDQIRRQPIAGKADRYSLDAARCRRGGRWSPRPISSHVWNTPLHLGLWLLLALVWGVGVSPPHASTPAASSTQLEGTAEHVRVMDVRRLSRSDTLLITLRIDSGYHVNANPASFDYLIPTSVAFDGIVPDHLAYPMPSPLKAGFADTPIDVYEGDIVIAASFPPGALDRIRGLGMTVSTQACTEQICLPPADIPARARW